MKGFRYLITDNMKLKLVAVLMAVMLWFAIAQMGESKLSISVRVVPQGLPRHMILKTIDPDYVLVTVNGPVSALKNLKAKDLAVTVNLFSAKEGSLQYTLSNANVTVPGGIKIEEIKPEQILLDIDRVLEKRLKVVVKLDQRWEHIYRVRSFTPTHVTVEGAADALRHVTTIETAPIDVSFEGEEEVQEVGLQTEGLSLRAVRPETVRVTLRRQ